MRDIIKRWRVTATVAVVIVLLAACSPPPENPKSAYFARLLQLSTDSHSGFDLLDPRIPDTDISLTDDLFNDGFYTKPAGGTHPELRVQITCNGVEYWSTKGFEEDGYSRRFYWGGTLATTFTSYHIDVTVSSNCVLLSMWGYWDTSAL